MELIVMDQTFRPVALIDEYTSAIWTERYNEAGDFELILPASSEYLSAIQGNYYVGLADSDVTMMIENIGIRTSEEDGTREVVVSGRSLEALLERRIVWDPITCTQQVQDAVYRIINDSFLNPGNGARKVSTFSFDRIQNDPVINNPSYTVNSQFDGTSVYEAVKTLCDTYNIGFRIRLSVTNRFVFSLYYGVDRTANQFNRDAVVFSSEFDNLISSEYLQSFKTLKNLALVAGETKDDVQTRITVYGAESEPAGLERREIYVSASDIKSSYTDEDETEIHLTPEEYQTLLRYRGFQTLAENRVTETLDGSVENHMGPVYGEDFFVGDFVTIQNDYGVNAVAQVTEYIRSYNEEGYSEYPTFAMVS